MILTSPLCEAGRCGPFCVRSGSVKVKKSSQRASTIVKRHFSEFPVSGSGHFPIKKRRSDLKVFNSIRKEFNVMFMNSLGNSSTSYPNG